MICGPTSCGCSFQSVGLQISGSGQPGDPLILEPAGPGIVALKSDVTSPFLGQTIYETSTGRLYVYDGTDWVIYGGNWPRVNAWTTTPQPVADTTIVNVLLNQEAYDTDGFHTINTAVFTVPTGLGGDYHVNGYLRFATASGGYRYVRVNVANNAVANELSVFGDASSAITIPTLNNGGSFAKDVRLIQGATVTLQAVQNQGGPIDYDQGAMTMHMIRHIPSLV